MLMATISLKNPKSDALLLTVFGFVESYVEYFVSFDSKIMSLIENNL